MQRVRKAVIPAAGLGTRFLPATKAVPKEMLPIVDVPTLQLVVEEAVASGIEEVIVVNGRGKGAIEDHFDHAYELEHTMRERGKSELADQVERIARMVRLVSVRQKQPLGLGHAVLSAREIVGDEPFAVMLGDDIYQGKPPAVGELIGVFQQHGLGAVSVMEVAAGQEHLYGVVKPGQRLGPAQVKIDGMVEKPAPGTAPSRLAIVGRYVLPPSIWPILAGTRPGKGNEIQLTDALVELAAKEGMVAATLTAERHDAGDRLGYLRANLCYALERPELRAGVLAMCEELLARGRK
jgi:UTP--glucose-1-phosphate uridylyltransferase